MINLIVEASKYVLAALMLIYTVSTFYFSRMRSHARRNVASKTQTAFLFLIHFIGNMIIVLKTMEAKLFVFYLVQLVFFIFYISIYIHIYRRASRILLNINCALLMIGLIMLTRLNPDRAIRQFIIVAVAAVITLAIPLAVEKIGWLDKASIYFGIFGILALLVVSVAGTTEFGAKMSVAIGKFSIQPSEFVKITFVFMLAGILAKGKGFKEVCISGVFAAFHAAVLVSSRDLGTTLIFCVAYLFMVYTATQKFRYFLLGIAGGGAAGSAAYLLFSHVQVRVNVWLNPWEDVLGDGWQILQSLFAIGTGGWTGMGLYQGKADTIPVVTKDFIFSAVSEEMGGIVALCVCLVCLALLLHMLWIATWMEAKFYKLLALGLAAIYGFQVFLNIGGVIKFIPSTGITLPFVSYGGSSVLSTFIMMGIIQGLYIIRQNEVDRIEKQKLEQELRQKLEQKRAEAAARQRQAEQSGQQTRHAEQPAKQSESREQKYQ